MGKWQPQLISDLENGGVQFKGEVTNEWVAKVYIEKKTGVTFGAFLLALELSV